MKRSKGSNRHIHLGKLKAKFPYLGIGKHSVSHILTLHVILAALLDHVVHVVTRCAGKEMRRIAARWPVTSVEYAKAVGNGTMMNLIRNAIGALGSFTIPDKAVTMLVLTALPVPAIIRAAFIYLFPESVSDGTRGMQPDVMADDKAHRLALNMSEFGISSFGDGGWFTTAAHAQPAGIWVNFWCRPGLCVAVDIAEGFSLDPSCFLAVSWGNLGFGTTAAMTVTVRDFVRGMLTHVNVSFQTLTMPGDACNVAPALLLDATN